MKFNQAEMTLPPGQKGNETISLTSLNGFAGNLSLSARVPVFYNPNSGIYNPNTVTATMVPTSVFLRSGGTVTATVIVGIGPDEVSCAVQCWYAQDTDIEVSTSSPSSTSSVSGSFKVLVNESLTMTSFGFPSDSIANLTLRNTGPSTVTLFNYNVTDQAGDQYTCALCNIELLGSGIGIGSTMTVNVSIGTSCGYCTLKGTAFTFVAGARYVFSIESSRWNLFSFAIVK
ncbi:hypothetical protein J2P12_05130 [Candidatus Bathyarchaeota archaeon]|nr:hypothetical protein [Candidatus Bathyarchaeota archaeon]